MKKMFVPLVVTLTLVAQTTSSDAPQFTQDGQLVLPKDYREWVYLSSGLGMTYGPTAQADQGNPMFDNVFVNRTGYNCSTPHAVPESFPHPEFGQSCALAQKLMLFLWTSNPI
jgi:hypothetical protein